MSEDRYMAKPVSEPIIMLGADNRCSKELFKDAVCASIDAAIDNLDLDAVQIAITDMDNHGRLNHRVLSFVDGEAVTQHTRFVELEHTDTTIPPEQRKTLDEMYENLTDGLFLKFDTDGENQTIEKDQLGFTIFTQPQINVVD